MFVFKELIKNRIDMHKGVVKWFNTTKGFGFITPDQGNSDVFVHITEVEKSGIERLNEGQRVQFELETQRGKTAAVNIKIAD